MNQSSSGRSVLFNHLICINIRVTSYHGHDFQLPNHSRSSALNTGVSGVAFLTKAGNLGVLKAVNNKYNPIFTQYLFTDVGKTKRNTVSP